MKNYFAAILVLFLNISLYAQCLQVNTSLTNALCQGDNNGSFQLTPTNGQSPYTYNWGTGSTTVAASYTISDLPANFYTVTATDNLGCDTVMSFTINEPAALSASTSVPFNFNGQQVSCSGSCDATATIAVSGGTPPYLVDWSSSGQTTTTANGLCAGIHTVTATDANACTEVDTFVVLAYNPGAATLSSVDVSCHGGSDGSATVQMSGAVPPYTYLWNNGQTTATVSGLTAGLYTVTVSDLNNCPLVGSVSINQPTAMNVSNTSLNNVSCFNTNDGSATVAVSGGVAPYEFLWSNGSTSLNLSNLAASTYCLTVTDNNDCTSAPLCLTITQPAAISLSSGPTTTESCQGACDVSVGITATGGTTPYIYSIDSGQLYQPMDSFHNLCADRYFVFVQDIAGCFGYDTFDVLSPHGSVWPGDANDDNIANNFDILPIGLHHGTTGTMRANASINWTCQPSQDWGSGINGMPAVDLKHVDCDGNGVINGVDTHAIVLNWSQTHQKNAGPNVSNGVVIYVDTATTNPGDTVSLPIILGNSLQTGTAYGIAFSISYDTAGIQSGSVSLDFSNSWLGNINTNMIALYKDFYAAGEVEVGMTRTDQASVTGSGAIAHIEFTIKDDVLPKSNFIRLDFNIDNVLLIDALGSPIATAPQPGQIMVINDYTAAETYLNKENTIKVFPNPTQAMLNIESTVDIEQISVFDVGGKLMQYQNKLGNSSVQLQMHDWNAGLYILKVATKEKLFNIRVLKH